ncbi:hypothetical protein G9C85_14320 [Halorubellus sp. JP-L1]|uniref:hypothetical protein n=1 Tax=Halorubellus sp. JP-L1 TaxID=2715753 RepID=UPI0014099FEF|nr:hypothetical protein [Halorubellus sp. JP-L1]NHN42795.1 hypothetical protein [Halorubellus sp. JP-L1]
MSLIDLTINKPALKRTEVVDSTDETRTASTDEGRTASTEAARTASTDETDTGPTDEAAGVSTGSSGRLRRTARNVGLLGVGVVGLLTLRKLRGRRKNESTAADDVVADAETESVDVDVSDPGAE